MKRSGLLMIFSLTTLVCVCITFRGISQPGVTYIDVALNNSRMYLLENGERAFTLIGGYKVIGTPFLFSEKNPGDIFSEKETAYNLDLSYNTYNQEISFYSTANPNQPLMKKPGDLDSFTLYKNDRTGITSNLKYIYGPVIGASDKCYYQQVAAGSRFNLYKRYKTEIGFVSTNLIQSEIKQFDLSYEYFYSDSTVKGVKRLKQNVNSILKEFKPVKDLSGIIKDETFSLNPEEALKKAFEHLNN
jgi:hypothetical protein